MAKYWHKLKYCGFGGGQTKEERQEGKGKEGRKDREGREGRELGRGRRERGWEGLSEKGRIRAHKFYDLCQNMLFACGNVQ